MRTAPTALQPHLPWTQPTTLHANTAAGLLLPTKNQYNWRLGAMVIIKIAITNTLSSHHAHITMTLLRVARLCENEFWSNFTQNSALRKQPLAYKRPTPNFVCSSSLL